MNGTQYEEFCRLFLANELRISIDKIRSDMIPNTIRPGSSQYSQQIDFWWQDENNLIEHVNIADAKWRSSNKVEKGDVEKLLQAKEGIAAHKAMMITNNDFTKGARAVAENHRIALHIVRPNFDYTILNLDVKDREKIQTQLRGPLSGSKPYIHTVVYRAVDSEPNKAEQSSDPSETSTHSKGIKRTPSNRMAQPPSHRRAPSGTQKVQGGRGGPRTGGRGGAVQKGTGPARGSGGRSNRGK